MRLGGRILMIIGIIVTVISALFCIIGLSTKGWLDGGGLFCNGCYKPPAALSVISFILLIVTIIALVLQMFEILTGALQLVPITLLFVATIFLLGTFVSATQRVLSYSFDLMVVAHFCSYIALAIIAYWLGQSSAGSN
ncbi:unnamed protein product [Rotaria sp. Silwood2]|nr:unnamed protein product [Rotaria sp. Silwood2]CAF3497560.1 unnamed protein product [Rotaria sp. Silwood2]CAF4327847.1 unnamed protein product [Rotaria sp. Silwood2]CAF4641394.1 unnamed protein product [Rotaria sp. Silwood2]